jgi:endogenous inhibitor of DNA gyrase (YacG/DUF329 family)
MFMFLNGSYELPKCPICGNPINESKDFSQFIYCSQKCAKQNISLQTINNAKRIYRRFLANTMGKL